jgi:alpha-ketoglutaric semialdehyde dehydrogenase
VRNSVFIDGAWLATTDEHEVRNPADTREVVDTVSWATPSVVSDAFDAARRAAPGWARTAALTRSDLMHRAAGILADRRDTIAHNLVREEGKQLADAAGEVDRSVAILRYFATACLLPDGQLFPPEKPGTITMLRRLPVGVVSVVTPFNFPLLVPVWKIAPALAFGNTVVWKPSELVPLSAAALVDALAEAGLPAGVINLVHGGNDVGAAMSQHDAIDAITFTGSTHVGRIVQQAAAQRSMKVQLELGGSNPAVVLRDADLTASVEHVVKGAFGAAGQRCTAIRRAIIDDHIHDEFVDALAAKVAGWTMGPGLDAATQMPPMVSARQRSRALDGVNANIASGARLVCGGIAPTDDALMYGHFLAATVLDNITESCFTWDEEIFGPVLSVIRASSADEAIAIANATPYGLNAGIFTTDVEHALRLGPQLRAGMVHINAVGGFPPHVPFGGFGDSGFGPLEQGTTAVDFFTNSQILNLNPRA